jgi:membrane-bound lytic murein transglycosylase D
MDEQAPTYDRGEKVIHRVRRGETLQKIAVKYRTTIGSVRQWNRLPGSTIRPGQRLAVFYATRADAASPDAGSSDSSGSSAAGAEATGVYRVRSGDTLYSIAQRFNMTVQQLRSVNNLARKRVIKPGDRLRVVAPDRPETATSEAGGQSSSSAIRYRVVPGDTLERIATRHQVKIDDLVRLNNLGSADDLVAGMVLTIRSE